MPTGAPLHWSTTSELVDDGDGPGRRLVGGPVTADTDALVAAVEEFGSPLVLVSPEVGLTVVPDTEAGRRFADALGALNQQLAAVCDRVVLVIAGQPLTLTPQRS